MSKAKRLVIIGISFGMGFAVTLSIIIGAFFWHQSRPRPWNTKAIIAIYDHVDTEGVDNNFVFYYTLHNATEYDYKISNLSDVITMAVLKKQNSLSGSPNDEFFKPDCPIFIPVKQRIRFAIHLKHPFDNKLKEGATKEERKKYREYLEKYADEQFSNLGGFVLFDEANRYQINLACGWKKDDS